MNKLIYIRYWIVLLLMVVILILSGCGQSQNIPQDNSQSTPSAEGRPPTASRECPSQYDGTYQGIFTYLYDIPVKDEYGNVLEYKTETSGIRLSATLKCQSRTDKGIFLEITHAIVSHPDFGCQAGCDLGTPEAAPWLNVAFLPLEGTTATHPSSQSMGLYIHFPNEMEITTNGFEGALYASMDGQVLSNSLDPTYQGTTYSVMYTGGNVRFPSEATAQDGRINLYGYKSWTLSKTT